MISKRLKTIASFINKNDAILDVGCDHALLPIFLIKNNITNIADGSDVSEKVLDKAKQNIEKYSMENLINLYLSDGLENIDIKKYNTLVICGMGYSTIVHILESNNLKNINKLIIQTNNEHDKLRLYMNKENYCIYDEVCLEEHGKYYDMIVYCPGEEKLSSDEILCGKYNKNNIKYYHYVKEKLEKILNRIPKENQEEIDNISKRIDIYNKYISKGKIVE